MKKEVVEHIGKQTVWECFLKILGIFFEKSLVSQFELLFLKNDTHYFKTKNTRLKLSFFGQKSSKS